MEKVFIGVLPLIEAKSMQQKMQAKGATLILDHNEKTCTRGCTVTVEAHCEEKYLPILKEVMSQNYHDLMQGLDVDFEQINSVFDASNSEATCPACGTKFSTDKSECPDCGLVFFAP